MRPTIRKQIIPLVALILATSCSRVRATWYSENIENGADIIMMDLRWPWWPSGTYYANWNSGFNPKPNNLSFYAGFVAHVPAGPGSRPNPDEKIQSSFRPGWVWTFWGSDKDGTPVRFTDVAPNLFIKNDYGGEGSSGTMGGEVWPFVQCQRWYTMLGRVWQPLGKTDAAHAYVGRWVKDQADGRWHLIGVSRLPIPATSFTGNSGFIEPLTSEKAVRSRQRRFGYFRKDGRWLKSDTIAIDKTEYVVVNLVAEGDHEYAAIEYAQRPELLPLQLSGRPLAGDRKHSIAVKQPNLPVLDESGRQSSWEMGPFVKLPNPVLWPRPESEFMCPVLGKKVRWEEQNVYNPAAVVRDGKVYLFYRADDKNPALKWGRTCRIGMAWSEDGVHFTRHPTPVLYPDNDEWKKHEWEGGCEDLHIVGDEDGAYYMNYTTWNGSRDTVSVASSRDLLHWTKHGPAFRKAGESGGRSGVVISKLVGDRLIAARINGKYWMYYTHPCALARSENLIDWTPTGKAVWPGGGREAGAIALLRDENILLMTQGGHHSLGAWTLRQALIDRNDLTTVLKEQKEPFLYPEYEWEKRGFSDNTTVANTLVPFKGQWWLYYGGADRHIGLAVFRPKAGAPFSSAPEGRIP